MLNITLIGKDAIKETLFDSLGWHDREWSRKLGAATMQILYLIAAEMLSKGNSIIVEANFKPGFDTPQMRKLASESGCRVAQVYCMADDDTIVHRILARAASGERHPGHVDNIYAQAEIREVLAKREHIPLALDGTLITLDTTDFNTIDLAPVLETLRAILA